MKSTSFMGLCRSNPKSPIYVKHVIELMKRAGELKNMPLLAITGFNSNIEDYVSGKCIALMIYYYCLHYAQTFIEPTLNTDHK